MSAGSSGAALGSVPGALRSPHLLVFLAMLFLGANFVVVRGIYELCPPSTLSMWRWGGAALILLPFTWSGLREAWPTIQKSWVVLVSCGVLMPMGSLMAYLAMAKTVAVNGAIIQSLTPVFIVLLAGVLLIDRINIKQALGLVVAIVGVVGIITRGNPEILFGLRLNPGDLLLLLSACGMAGYTVVFKRSAVKIPPPVFLTILCAIGAFFHIPFVAFEMAQGSFMIFNTATVLSIVFVAIFPSLLAVMFYNQGIKILGPNKASVYMYFMPVITAVLAFLFLGETIAMFHVFGTVLIILGVYTTARGTPLPAQKPADGEQNAASS